MRKRHGTRWSWWCWQVIHDDDNDAWSYLKITLFNHYASIVVFAFASKSKGQMWGQIAPFVLIDISWQPCLSNCQNICKDFFESSWSDTKLSRACRHSKCNVTHTHTCKPTYLSVAFEYSVTVGGEPGSPTEATDNTYHIHKCGGRKNRVSEPPNKWICYRWACFVFRGQQWPKSC